MSLTLHSSAQAPSPTSHSGAYRTLWRWHFYAALFVMPFLIVLALTGTLYCFQLQIEPLLYPKLMKVEPRTTPELTESALLSRASAAMPGGSRATTASINPDPRRSAEFVFRLPDGDKQSIYLNPYTGEVLGTLSVEHRLMRQIRLIHRGLLIGKPGELVMELAACWTLVMIGTGLALWWPREKFSFRGQLWPHFARRGRPLWKELHAVLGFWLATGALAFVLTGLPWSGSWGKQFKALATSAQLGYPVGAWGDSHLHSTLRAGAAGVPATSSRAAMNHHDHLTESMPGMTLDNLPLPQTPWATGDTRVPQSRATMPQSVISLDEIIVIARARGLSNSYDIALPTSPTGVYTVSYFPPDPRDERTLHIDQYSGALLTDIGYRDYGAVAKAVSYGTSLHMGRFFGLANQLLCAVISLGLVAMAVTGCVMWWKRRPQRALGAPARPRIAPPMRAWKSGLILIGAVFPLMGTTLLGVWIVDRVIFGRSMRQLAS
jgi:uncharacterized iron-regulated membrane protein